MKSIEARFQYRVYHTDACAERIAHGGPCDCGAVRRVRDAIDRALTGNADVDMWKDRAGDVVREHCFPEFRSPK